jgi:hypothetical protein
VAPHAGSAPLTDADLDDDLATDQLVLPERAVTPSPLNLPHDRTAEAFWHLLADTRAAGCDGQARPWDCDRRG